MHISLISFLNIPYEVQLETRNWRNSEHVAKYFKISHISEEQHKNWLKSLNNNNPTNIAFIISKDDNFIGVTYFHSIDYEKKEADWGIYIYEQNLRGCGIGKIVLEECLQYAKNILNMSFVYLDVLKKNNRAIKLYEKLGFERINSDDKNYFRYINKL